MVQLSSYHPIKRSGMHRNAEQAQLTLILYQDGRGALLGGSVTKIAQLANVPVGIVTKSTFGSMRHTSVNRIGDCCRQSSFEDCAAHALV